MNPKNPFKMILFDMESPSYSPGVKKLLVIVIKEIKPFVGAVVFNDSIRYFLQFLNTGTWIGSVAKLFRGYEDGLFGKFFMQQSETGLR